MKNILNPEELEAVIGENIKALRLQRNWNRKKLSAHAGVSLGTLRNLELGFGSSIKTLIRVVRALGKEDWLENLAPQVSVNPLHMKLSKSVRQRARSKKKDDGEKKEEI